ncbi:MAG: hypothetical protein GY751_11995 [Bacteroidetes bacterium]|nr:hypothetical protein [Bacteroidota bacterium]
MKTRKSIIFSTRLLSGLLLLVYLLLLIFSYNLKGYVKKATSEYSIVYLETELDKQLQKLNEKDVVSTVTGILDQVIPGVGGDGKLLKKKFREAVEKLFSKDVIDEAAMKAFYKEHKTDYESFSVVQAMKEKHYMANWIKVRFISTKVKLLRGIRSNIVCNMVIFLVIFLLSLFKTRTSLVYPLLVMIIISVTGSIIYITHQDWIFKILRQDFVGQAYLLFYAFMLLWIILPEMLLLLSGRKPELSKS